MRVRVPRLQKRWKERANVEPEPSERSDTIRELQEQCCHCEHVGKTWQGPRQESWIRCAFLPDPRE